MSTYKKLNQQDAYISTYTARKSWEASGSQYNGLGIQNIVGLSGSGVYLPNDSDLTYGGNVANSGSTSFNRRLVFESNRHLYYSQFSDSVLITSSSYENYLQSSYEVSGSRHLNNRVAIFSLPKEMYGTHIEPYSVSILPDFINSGSAESGSFDNYVINNYSTDEGVDSISSEKNLYLENIDFLFGSTGANCKLADVDYIQNESDYIQETIPNPGEYLDTTNTVRECNEIVDDGEGRLYFKYSIPRVYVGNAIYPHGQLIITDDIVAMYYNHYFDAVLKWKSNLPIYTHNYHCRIKTDEFNHTLNRTALETSDGQIANLISGSAFQPYITTVGLYNDTNQLIAVGKLGQPIPKSAETDMVIINKIDMNFGVDRGFVDIVLVCTQYYVFRNDIYETGPSGGRSPGRRRLSDYGDYALYRRSRPYSESQINIPTDSEDHTVDYKYITAVNYKSNRSLCYVDVKVSKYKKSNGIIYYTYDFGDYNPDANAVNPTESNPNIERNNNGIPKQRSHQFFKDILGAYLLLEDQNSLRDFGCKYPMP